jgi:catechol 2,3-dioxygenase-like lactoylglutathione lyase family enzyme
MMTLSTARVMATIPAHDLNRARQYYADALGLMPAVENDSGGSLFVCGNESWFLLYETSSAGTAQQTLATFVVDNLEATMADLRARGVVFEEYDFPGLRTENGIATLGNGRSAWFRDSEGNVLAVTELFPESQP